jgi:hypothetical protein
MCCHRRINGGILVDSDVRLCGNVSCMFFLLIHMILVAVQTSSAFGCECILCHFFSFSVSSHALSLLAQEGKKADGLILESPFNNLRDELKEHPFSKVREMNIKM